MLDYRIARPRRVLMVLLGVSLVIGSAWAWARSPVPANVPLMGIGGVCGWWIVSRSRSRLVLFQRQGLYWDGFRHFLLERGKCHLEVQGKEVLLVIGNTSVSPTLRLDHLQKEAVGALEQWCSITDESGALRPAQQNSSGR